MNFELINSLTETELTQLYDDIIEFNGNEAIATCYYERCSCRNGSYNYNIYSSSGWWSVGSSHIGLTFYHYHSECCRNSSDFNSITFLYCK